jgi:hypothetical protein
MIRAHRIEGAALFVGGTLIAGLMWYWLTVPFIVAVAVSGYGLAHASGPRAGG